MNTNDKWLADQALEILGNKDKGTIDYLKSIAKKSDSIHKVEKFLHDFDVPTENNPRNQHFASDLWTKFGSRT